MPALNVSKSELLNKLESNGIKISEEKLEETVFDFGVELDDIYEEEGKTLYKFDIPANRYDLLCFEGFCNAISSFLNFKKVRKCNYEDFDKCFKIIKNDTNERKHIACAIIKNISFTDSSFDSFISYQDKLHSSLGRHRSIVAIGTHDFSKIKGSVEYKTTSIKNIKFNPLKGTENNFIDLQKYFENDKKIGKYFNLLSNKNESVAFFDDNGIISIPPIINSERTKITKESKNIFVEVTGTDFNKVNIALNLILCNFPGEKIQKCQILNGKNEILITPVIDIKTHKILISEINKKLKLNLNKMEIEDFLKRMMYEILKGDDNNVVVSVPVFRSDVLHECDVIEDIAVAYGFNNFKMELPDFYTLGAENLLNKFSDKIRLEMALAGFNEVLTLTLLPEEENRLFIPIKSKNESVGSIPEFSDYVYNLNYNEFNNMIIKNGVVLSDPVVLSNPKSKEYEVVRTSLLPGVIKSINSNLHAKIPIKIFEVSDVVVKRNDYYNIKNLCGVISSTRSMLEDLQGPLSLLLQKCGFNNYKYIPMNINNVENIYLENQCAWVLVNEIIVGCIGVLHPKICNSFEIPYACSSFELDVQLLFNLYKQRNF